MEKAIEQKYGRNCILLGLCGMCKNTVNQVFCKLGIFLIKSSFLLLLIEPHTPKPCEVDKQFSEAYSVQH